MSNKGNVEVLSYHHSTSYTTEGSIDLTKYKYLILSCEARVGSGVNRPLASTIVLPNMVKYNDTNAACEAKYNDTYKLVVYFTGSPTNATINGKVENSTYGEGRVFGVI